MSKRITLEQLTHMKIGEIANLSQQEIQELIRDADESIRKAKLLRKWLNMKDAPKDKPILLDVGYPWPVVGIWNDADKKWVYANLQCGQVDGKWNDTYWDNEQESELDGKGNRNIDGWMHLLIPQEANNGN